MRIISGKARGTKLETLAGINTRPTLDRVKESLFNIIQNDIKKSVFLDLFAGSGSIGLEAASRGAKKVILCDKSKDAANIISKNIEKTHLENVVELYNMDFKQLLSTAIEEDVDIVYIDPPYKSNYAVEAIELLIKNKLVDNNSMIIVETDDEERFLKDIKDIKVELTDKRKYGRAHVLFLAKS